MKTNDYTTSFAVEQSPEDVFNAINNVRAWWSGDIDGSTDRLGAEFTELRFTHVGLVPTFECYGGCSDAWGFYINDSLRSLIATGKGQPNRTGDANWEKASQ